MQKILTYVGFAIKSNKKIFGLDDLLKTKKKIGVILYSSSLEPNSYTKLDKFSNINNIKAIKVDPDLFVSLNISGVKVLGITDPNLAKAIIKTIND